MDQLCAQRDDAYRRCICSGRLDSIRDMQRVLNQTNQQLIDFQDFNIESVDKTAGEVRAMLSASAGEYAAYRQREHSDSMNQLAGISQILAGTRQNALSTAGRLDIAGDIGQIWNFRDFISGADIATLEGEKLYNAVHNQCYEMVGEACGPQATLNMVVSAYGMLIEQDCNIIMTALNQQKNQSAAAIRQTERDLNVARLQNYNVHNSAEINECIAQVRHDITMDTACGANYVHCLDVSGMFLNYATGEPIYTPDFFRLEHQLSLDGDVFMQPQNQLLLANLNKKKQFAARGLDTCRDLSAQVWEEFLRQAVAEIYQKQQQKVRQVKDECVAVVTQCYDMQRGQLRDFSNRDQQALLGHAVVATEEMCKYKMDTCSNLYGGGEGGFAKLLDFMRNVQNAVIADDCERYLDQQMREYCSFALDRVNPFPYPCRVKPAGTWQCTSGPDNACWVYGINTNAADKSYKFDQDDSLHFVIAKLALENCMRPEDNATVASLSTDVQKAVQSTFDRLFDTMWGVLGGICADMGGEWVREITQDTIEMFFISEKDGTEDSIELEAEVPEYKQKVFSHRSWGQCERAYCETPGDMFVDKIDGKKKCCGPGMIINNQKNGCIEDPFACQLRFPGSRVDLRCKDTAPNTTEHGCVYANCRCDTGLVVFRDGVKPGCKLYYCEMTDNTRIDHSCVVQSTGPNGCLRAGCRCTDGLWPMSTAATKDEQLGEYLLYCGYGGGSESTGTAAWVCEKCYDTCTTGTPVLDATGCGSCN